MAKALVAPPEQDLFPQIPGIDEPTRSQLKATLGAPKVNEDQAYRLLNTLPVDQKTKADLWDTYVNKVKPAAVGMGNVKTSIQDKVVAPPPMPTPEPAPAAKQAPGIIASYQTAKAKENAASAQPYKPEPTGMGDVRRAEDQGPASIAARPLVQTPPDDYGRMPITAKTLPAPPPDTPPVVLNSRQRAAQQGTTTHANITDFSTAKPGPHVQMGDVVAGVTPRPQLPPPPEPTAFQRAKDVGVNMASSLVSAVPSVNASIANVITAVAENVKSLTGKLGIPTDERLTPYLKNYAKEQESLASALVPDSGGLLSQGVYGGMQSLGQNLLMLPFGLGQEAAAAEKAILMAMGITSGGAAYGQARQQGVSPGAAAILAVSQGAIEVATEKIPVHRFMEGFRSGSTFSKILTSQLAAEIPGEEVATLLQDFNEFSVLPENRNKTFGDYLRERPSAAAETAIATIVGSAGQAGAARILNKVMGGSTTMETPPQLTPPPVEMQHGSPLVPQAHMAPPPAPPNIAGRSGDHIVYTDGTTAPMTPHTKTMAREYGWKELSGADILALQQQAAVLAPPPPQTDAQILEAQQSDAGAQSLPPVSPEIQATLEQPPAAITVREGQIADTLPMEPGAEIKGGDSTIAGELPPGAAPPKTELPAPPAEPRQFTVTYGTRSSGNQQEEFDTLEEAQAFAREQDETQEHDFVTLEDDKGNELPWGEIKPAEPLSTKTTVTINGKTASVEHDGTDYKVRVTAANSGEAKVQAKSFLEKHGVKVSDYEIGVVNAPVIPGHRGPVEFTIEFNPKVKVTPQVEKPPLTPGQQLVQGGRGAKLPNAPAETTTPATPQYSVRARDDGRFEILKPNGQPVRIAPFTDRAAAETEAAKQQAKFDEMTRPEGTVPPVAPKAETPPAPKAELPPPPTETPTAEEAKEWVSETLPYQKDGKELTVPAEFYGDRAVYKAPIGQLTGKWVVSDAQGRITDGPFTDKASAKAFVEGRVAAKPKAELPPPPVAEAKELPAPPAEPDFKLTAPPDYADRTPKEREFMKAVDDIMADPKWRETEKLGAKNYRDDILEGLKAAEEAGEDFDPEYLNTDIGDEVTKAYEKVYRPELVEAEAKEAEEEQTPKQEFPKGTAVEVKFPDQKNKGQFVWNPGEITEFDTLSGEYDVKVNGNELIGIKAEYIRKAGSEKEPKTPIDTLAFRVRDAIKAGQSIDNPTLTKWAIEAFGGTRGEGKYDPKMAYDAAEAGINMAIREPGVVDFKDVAGTLKRLREMVARMPTQADRTAEQTQLQQFSTPPEESFAATLAAAVTPDMVVLEPSAGNGGIAIMAEAAGAKVITNELSARRKQILESLGFPAHSVDAEHLDALLDPSIRPDVVIMNPPFSSSAKGKTNKTEHGAKHVTQALLRLKEGGRLVAIVGRGMAHGRPGFAEWWDKLEQKYNVRANIGIDGKYYQKYGTGFDNQIIVIDKTGPTPGKTRGERLANIVRSENLSPEQAIEILTPLSKEDVRGRIEQASGGTTEPTVRNPKPEGRKPAPAPDIKGAPRGEREHPAPGEQPGTEPGGMGQLGTTPERPPGPLGERGGETGGGRLPGAGESQAPGGLGSQPGVAGTGQSERGGSGRPELTPPPAKTNAEAIGSVLDGPVSQDTIKDLKQGLQAGPRKKAARAIPKKSKTGQWSASMTPPPAGDYGAESITDLDPADQLNLLQFGAAQFKTTPNYDAWISKMKSELGADWAPYLPTAFDLIEAVAEAKGFKPEENAPPEEEKPEEEGIFAPYKVRKAKFDKSVPHPADMVESATMASVDPPDVTYKPDIPAEVIQEGRLSDVQLEAITYAGQRHQTKLPSGQTAGFWIGDGTGVGKGRTASGIILDNLMKGKKRALWLSIGQQLAVDAKRDLEGVGVPLPLLKQQDTKMAEAIPNKDGVLFSTYGMAAANWKQNTRERFNQITDWLGPEFDGVIVLDEGHKMKGALGTTVGGAVSTQSGTDAGAMGLALSKEFPNAKIVYVSATGATIARNMAYMDRLGLWGPGAPFPNFMGFLSAMDSGGVGAMEMLARDLKATGAYISRTLSFKGVEYDTIVHTLSPEETEQYKGMADFWADMSQQFEDAMKNSGQPKSAGRQMSQFYSTQQRFFLQVMTSLQLPKMFAEADKDLKEGKSIIISLINTNEGQVKRKVQEALASGEDLSDMDFTPREVMFELINKYFPVQEYETVHNDVTGQDEQIPMVDEAGEPVINRENLAMKEALLERLHSMSVPDNPIDAIVAHFGPKNVSEISGRKKRLEEGKYVGRKIEGVKIKDRDEAEIKRFQDGITRVAIITSKGSTGISLHADKGAKNKQRRVMYAMQLSWSADQQMQTTPGRAHRAFQESPPMLKLFRTNLKGQERLVNTVSARLASLGGITKGGRETLGGGIFGIHDLTDKYGSAALARTYGLLLSGRIPGIENGHDILRRMGMLNGDGQINNNALDDVDRFLNRIMSLPVNEQNAVFEAFFEQYQHAVERAKESGEFDVGVHKIRGENFRVIGEPETVYTHPESGAKTQLVHLEGEMPLNPISFETISDSWRSNSGFVVNKRSGKLYAARARQSESVTHPGWYVQLTAPTGKDHATHVSSLNDFRETHAEISGKELEKRWTEEYEKAPKFETGSVHILTGAIYPIYNRVMGGANGVGSTRIGRVTLKNGKSFVGLQVEPEEISGLKQRLGIGTALGTATGQQIYDLVRGGSIIQLDNGWRIKGSKVRGESRIEVVATTGVPNVEEMKRHGTIEEIIDHKRRFFVPTSEDGPNVIDSILKLHAAVKDETVRNQQPPQAGQTSAMKSPREEAPPPPLGKKNAMSTAETGLPAPPKSPLEQAAEDLRKLGDLAKNIVAPGTRGLPAEITAPVIREMGATRDIKKAQAEHALEKAYKYFKAKPVEEGYRFIKAIEAEEIDSLPPEEQEFANIIRDWLDTTWTEVRKRNGIQSLIEGYFPHLWENPNKAREAIQSGQIYGGKRPLEGRKTFLKKRSIATFAEGLDAGLTPKFQNPIDMVLHQLDQEMKFITAYDAKEELKALGVLRFKSVFDDKFNTTGMAQIDDPMGTVFGSPTVTVKEAYDEVMFEKLNDFAKSLGVDMFRKVNIGNRGGAGEAWGYANTNRPDGSPDRIWSKVGGPETVLTHEIGHVLDHRYGLQSRLDPFNDELDKLAEERHRDKEVPKEYMDYVKTPSERIANLIHAMVHTPELAESIAPKALAEMKEFLSENPELEPLLDIKPSLVLGSQQHKMGVGGIVIRGHYYAPESAAKLINNYLSVGLSGNKGYRAYRAIGNMLNQVQLGLSGFHFTFTAMDAAISKGALGLQQVAQGNFREGLKNMAMGNIVVAPWTTYLKGSKVLKEGYAPGSQGEFYAKVIDDLIKGGGRLKMDSFYKNSAIAKFWDAWGAGKYTQAGFRSLFALMEYSSKPLMEHWVPRVKLGVFADLSQQMLSELPEDATDMEKAQVLGRAWDSVDNRMGQLVYDNLFWHKATKDIGMGMVRSLGWNIGTWRELGGAGVDIAKGAVGKGNMWSGGKFKLPPRVAYALWMTATVMVMGAFYQYLRTGKWPEELKDYFFPKTGGKLPDGDAERVSLPSYAKDIYAYGHGAQHGIEEMFEGKFGKGFADAGTGLARTSSTTIGHKVHPEITMLLQAWQNKDFFGTEIRHEGDPGLDQIRDVLKFVGEQYVPFSLRNMKQRVGRESEEGIAGAVKGTYKGLLEHPGQAAESFFGVTPAPKSLAETPAERLASEYMENAMPKGERTKSQFQRSQMRSQIVREFNAKDPKATGDLQKAIREGKVTQSDVDQIKWSTGMSGGQGTARGPKQPLERKLKSANLEQLLNVFEIASPEEKALLVPMLRTRVYSKALLPAERKTLLPKALEAMKFRRQLSRPPGLAAPPPH